MTLVRATRGCLGVLFLSCVACFSVNVSFCLDNYVLS